MKAWSTNLLMSNRTAVRAGLGLLVAAASAGAVAAAVRAGWADRFEWIVFDALTRATSGYVDAADNRADRDLVVLAIDESTLRKFAEDDIRWPWTREAFANVVDFCRRGGAKAVVFDVLLQQARADTGEPEFERALREAAAAGMPVILAGSFSKVPEIEPPPEAEMAAGAVPVDMAAAAASASASVPGPPERSSCLAPARRFLAAGGLVADTGIEAEGDGVLRRISPLVSYRGRLYPTMALAAAWRLSGRPPLRWEPGRLVMGERVIPLDGDGKMTVRYNGPPAGASSPGTYRADRCYDPIAYEQREGRDLPTDLVLRPDDFRGKVVFVGATAAGLMDTKASPFAELHPGVEVHVNALDNILHGRAVRREWDHPAAPWAWFVLAALAGLAGTFLPAGLGLPAAGLLAAAAAAAGWHLFGEWGVSVRLVPPAAAVAAAYLGGLAGGYSLESRQRAFVSGAFSQFLSREVLDILMRHPERLALGGERQTVTVFFSDVAGFTALSEQVTPEQLVTYLNRYLTRMSGVLLRRGAYIDKFIGDAIMAFWGAPNPDPQHARNACLAAVDCVDEMERLAAEFRAEGFPPLACRIGLNTGTVICGMMGSEQKLNYTVMGDTVNTASRLEGANKPFGSRILASEETLAAAGDAVVAREVDRVRVKGRKQPVRLFEIVARRGEVPPAMAECLRLYESGLALYRARKWNEAAETFAEAARHDHSGHNPSLAYVERCREFAADPPPEDWDGVYEMKTK
jgi:adenylate cyclase